MIITIAMTVSDHTALKKSYFPYVVLHNLHRLSKGIQFSFFNLGESRLTSCFNSAGTKFQIFGPKNDND